MRLKDFPQGPASRAGQSWFRILAGMTALFAVLAPAEAAETDLYAKGATWAETMAGCRARYLEDQGKQEITLGPWWTTGALKAKGFSDALFPEQGIDLEAKNEKGEKVWSQRDAWQDGQVYNLPGANSHSTYLFRTIAVENETTASAGFGSDDGLEVWLNGEKIISNDVPRGPGPNQDRADLKLRAGENQLLMKIYNRTGGHGFYFALTSDPLACLWKKVAQDFPAESRCMAADLPEGGQLVWFKQREGTEIENSLLASVLEEVGRSGEALSKEFEALRSSGAPAGDARWLDCYAKALPLREQLRAARARLRLVDAAALLRAAQDLVEDFPGPCKDLQARMPEISRAAEELPGVCEAIKAGDVKAIERLDAFLALKRSVLLSNPLLDFDRLLLIQRGAGKLGLPQNWQGNCAIARTGYDNTLMTLSPVAPDGELASFYAPENGGFVGDVDLHFDADKMMFSMPGSHGRWQIWEIGADGQNLRQVTPGEHPDVDNYDPCYLPDGRIIFASTRCFQGIPCVGGGNTVANLCLMNADGTNIRQLCFDQDHNWCPTVLNSGRILFSRWEYSDTPHYFSRLLFNMNPDGTGQMEFYGSNSFWPNSMFYTRPIPGHPSKVVTIVSGHHGVPRMGELVILDAAKGRHEANGVVQRIPGYGEPVEPAIVDQLVNSTWPRFLHPYPLSEKYFLVSCQPTPDSLWGVYLVDIFDNMLLLCEKPGYAMLEPVPFRKTPTPPAIPDKVIEGQQDAIVYLADVYVGQGLSGVPRGTVKKLRVYEYHYTYPKMGGHVHVAVEGGWDVHRILGTVPVHEDGSASFVVPANTPIAVQPLDAEGKALQVMRSWFTAMPGEKLSCVGCHERQNNTAPLTPTMAMRQPPSDIQPWYGPTRGFSFKRDVQPVLDKYCTGCHKPRDDGKCIPDFTRKEKNGWSNFTPSYLALHPYVRRPGPESDYHVQIPLEWHADTSELIQMLEKGHKGVKLDPESWDRLVTWIDLNVPDHGTWHEHRDIPENFHERRLEMRTRYANRPEDPEVIPDIPAEPIEFVKPEPVKKNVGEEPAAPEIQELPADLPRELSFDLGNGMTMAMVLVPAGSFSMGDPKGCLDEVPVARVNIDKPFYMGRLEVTNAQYAAFDPIHENGYLDQQNKDHTTRGYPAEDPGQPAMRLSWDEARAFCQWLSEKTGRRCELPTEAQWEWACRAGTTTQLYYGSLDDDFGKTANLADASIKRLAVAGINPQPIANPNPYQDFVPKEPRFDDGERLMVDTGKYEPNPWGLCDMHGNVAEWTLSTFAPYPYKADDGRNAVDQEGKRVVRGGSWRDRPKWARSAFRLAYYPWQGVYNVGFRVICSVE